MRRVYGSVRNLAVSPAGRRLAATTRNQELVILDAANGDVKRSLKVSGASNIGMEDRMPVGFTSDGRSILTAGADGMLRAWDAVTGNARTARRAHDCKIGALAIGSRTGCAVTGAEDTTALVWDLPEVK